MTHFVVVSMTQALHDALFSSSYLKTADTNLSELERFLHAYCFEIINKLLQKREITFSDDVLALFVVDLA